MNRIFNNSNNIKYNNITLKFLKYNNKQQPYYNNYHTVSLLNSTNQIKNNLRNNNNYSLNKHNNNNNNNNSNNINNILKSNYSTITNNKQQLQQQQQYNNNKMTNLVPLAKIVEPTIENIIEAGKKIKDGGLVSFPTETVYGLGANALDEKAVLSIFQSKGRPLTDPVIVHVIDSEYAKQLLELTEKQKEIFKVLAEHFWPGPLTIVARSSELIPMIVTAQTGYVGVRYPKHDLAQLLIKHSGKPIAAPSANRFGHVSPTRALHVYDDLGHSDITILDCNKDYQIPCKIGIESTVLKIVSDDSLVILRKGGHSEKSIRQVINQHFGDTIKIDVINKTVSNQTLEGQEAPGQLLTHYAPDIQTFILENIYNNNNIDNSSSNNIDNNNSSSSSSSSSISSSINNIDFSDCVYIDFGNQLPNEFKNKCLAYRDLSESCDIQEASGQLFSVLRWSENVQNAKIILLPDLRKDQFKMLDNSEAVFDRIFRASSGKYANLSLSNNKVSF